MPANFIFKLTTKLWSSGIKRGLLHFWESNLRQCRAPAVHQLVLAILAPLAVLPMHSRGEGKTHTNPRHQAGSLVAAIRGLRTTMLTTTTLFCVLFLVVPSCFHNLISGHGGEMSSVAGAICVLASYFHVPSRSMQQQDTDQHTCCHDSLACIEGLFFLECKDTCHFVGVICKS